MQRTDAMPRTFAPAMLALGLLSGSLTAGDIASTRLPEAASVHADDGTARSENFSINAPAGDGLAMLVLEAAESHRREIARDWFGRELEDGIDRTFIHVDLTDDRDVGLAMLGEGLRHPCHRIWLRTSAERAVTTTLAHEIAHVVLSARFPESIPVWVTEGVACQYDDTARILARTEIIDRCMRLDRWPDVARLLDARSIDPTDVVSYAAAVSLTDFLVARTDRRTFIRFIATERESNWDAALQQWYGIASTSALIDEWRRWVRSDSRQDLVSQQQWVRTRRAASER